MQTQIKIIRSATVLNKVFAMLFCLFIFNNISRSQNIHLSQGIGDVTCRYSYAKVIRTLGKPDSTYSFDPMNMDPVPKSLAYNELFYDHNHVSIMFLYSMTDTLKRNTGIYCIKLFKGSSFMLNGDSLSVMDSAYVVNRYGKPGSVLKNKNELVIGYTFRDGKFFSLPGFYFDGDGELKEIRIRFGHY